MFTSILLLFAGVKNILLHVGLAGAMIALCLTLAYLSPVGRKTCLWLAFVIAVFVLGEVIGIHDEKVRVQAQQAVIERTVDKAVKKTEAQSSRRASDPWDKRRY